MYAGMWLGAIIRFKPRHVIFETKKVESEKRRKMSKGRMDERDRSLNMSSFLLKRTTGDQSFALVPRFIICIGKLY